MNASWNGAGVLTIGTPETLDPDDSLAQMILHETCHALCEGPESLQKMDWGLDNSSPAKRVHEHACLRLQAALADQYGLRAFFAATTMFRAYYDRLPSEPLAPSDDPAESALHRLARPPGSVPSMARGPPRSTKRSAAPPTSPAPSAARPPKIPSGTSRARQTEGNILPLPVTGEGLGEGFFCLAAASRWPYHVPSSLFSRPQMKPMQQAMHNRAQQQADRHNHGQPAIEPIAAGK